MKITSLVLCGLVVFNVKAQQQQQFTNVIALNNSNLVIQTVQNSRGRNAVNVTSSNVQSNNTKVKVQSNKTNPRPIRNTNTVRSIQRATPPRVVRQNTVANSNRMTNPNSAGNLGNFNVNDNNVGNTNEDNIVTNLSDNNLGNQFNPLAQVIENKVVQIQSQQVNIPSQSFVTEVKASKSVNVSLDVSVSMKSFSSSSGSSAKANRRTFHKKYHKFKRNFYGKLFAHKKSRHQVDICFNWR